MEMQYSDKKFYVRYAPENLKHLFYQDEENKLLFTRNPTTAMSLIAHCVDKATGDMALKLYNEQISFIEMSYADSSTAKIKATEGNEYFPYQKAGVTYAFRALENKKGVIIGDDMGLGKTVQAIGYINENKWIKKVLIISNAVAKFVWKNHLKEWLVNPMKTEVVSAGKKFPKDFDVLVINYDLIKKYWFELSVLNKWDVMVCDEAQYLKNHETARTTYTLGGELKGKKIAPIPCKKALFLTGTPIEARPSELWRVLNYIDPESFPYWEYMCRYCKPRYHKERGWYFIGADNIEELKERIRGGYMVRRLKKDVLHELPDKFETIVEIEDNKATQFELKELEKLTESLGNLQNLPMDKYHGITSMIRHKTSMLKVPYAVKYIKDVLDIGHKVLVFGIHKDVLATVRDSFPGCVGITGDTKENTRLENEKRFQTDPNCRLFYGNIMACGTALTLTAANVVIFVEFERQPGKNDQAADRAYRIGQKNNVHVVKFAFKDSIDSVFLRSEERNRKTLTHLLN